jgi:hypothetical protein
MESVGAAAVWAPYQARPGRKVLVVKDLAGLRGPASGPVMLPLRMYWSPAGRVFCLDDPFMLRSMYQVVLGEAVRAEELTVRRAWEERHPALRAATALAA